MTVQKQKKYKHAPFPYLLQEGSYHQCDHPTTQNNDQLSWFAIFHS